MGGLFSTPCVLQQVERGIFPPSKPTIAECHVYNCLWTYVGQQEETVKCKSQVRAGRRLNAFAVDTTKRPCALVISYPVEPRLNLQKRV
jgi:hypothetical protein